VIENIKGYTRFPGEFAQDIQDGKVEYITLLKNGKESSIKYRLVKVEEK
jgi:hypothetical protein